MELNQLNAFDLQAGVEKRESKRTSIQKGGFRNYLLLIIDSKNEKIFTYFGYDYMLDKHNGINKDGTDFTDWDDYKNHFRQNTNWRRILDNADDGTKYDSYIYMKAPYSYMDVVWNRDDYTIENEVIQDVLFRNYGNKSFSITPIKYKQSDYEFNVID